jgi:NADP-dependent 3-hydroxy acid dehydrogenase YdfG
LHVDLSQHSVWVTGAGSGIGRAMALSFAEAGACVALTGRNRDALEQVAAEISKGGGRAAIVVPADIRDRQAMLDVVEKIISRTGRLDILCANAGYNNPNRSWAALDWAEWDAVLDINIRGTLACVAAALEPMRRQRSGLILMTASWAGRFHAPVAGVPYGAAKQAVVSLSASLNAEEGVNGVRSTALCPGEVATPLLLKRPGFDPADAAKMIRPQDVAETALFVARMNPAVAIHEIVMAPVRSG